MIARRDRAWNADDYYKRDAQIDAQGWTPDEEQDEDFIPCECGSGFERGDCLPCWFDHHVIQIQERPR